MNKIEEAQEILKAFGLPSHQYNEMAALTFLAVCNIKENDEWRCAIRQSVGLTKGIMNFVNQNYSKNYAPNTRETFRRQVLHQFIQAGIVDYNPDDPSLPVNSPRTHYAITHKALTVVQAYHTNEWEHAIGYFHNTVGKLTDRYSRSRNIERTHYTMPDGTELQFTAGSHNRVQTAVLKEFAEVFMKDWVPLYIGDTAQKDLVDAEKRLKEQGIAFNQHGKLPDIIIYDRKRNWIWLIEAVTSHGPVSPKRLIELEEFLKTCPLVKKYVSAFPDMAVFKKHINNIAWGTHVWLVEFPDHMIHFNGDSFFES